MLDWNTIKELWPIGLVFGGHVVRVEVGQRLNKQKLQTLESQRKEDLASLERRRTEDMTGMHSRMGRHEKTTSDALTEIQRDIKTLLSRAG